MRVGFLFNHDHVHQVAHSLPIALALSHHYPDLEIVIATTNPTVDGEVVRLLQSNPLGDRLHFVRLRQKNPVVRRAVAILNGLIPAAKLAIYRDNLDFFRTLDALVVAEKTSVLLKTHYGLSNLKLIHTRHGAGDRAVGFNRASSGFDFVLVSGRKIRDRLIAETGLEAEQLATVGYPKFDLPRVRQLPAKLCGRPGPTVLYNPHASPHLSSWFRHGRQVLDYFLAHPEYNLIFAPHVMLFERKVVVSIDKMRLQWAGRLDPKYAAAPNIHVDLGSHASTDMSYTEAADIYLGDVSSQIYEFLLRPRPCVFLNSQRAAFADDPNYAHWAAGPVIEAPEELGTALTLARLSHDRFKPIQEAMFARSIDLEPMASSIRAANAIVGFLLPDRKIAATTPAASARCESHNHGLEASLSCTCQSPHDSGRFESAAPVEPAGAHPLHPGARSNAGRSGRLGAGALPLRRRARNRDGRRSEGLPISHGK